MNRFLTEHFSHYVDYDFTARLEDDLDAISRGEREWVPLLREFWREFEGQVKEKDAAVSRRDLAQARELGADPASGRPVTVRMGRYGPFAQIGTPEDEEKPRFAGLRPGQRLDTISLEEALALFQLPRDLGATPEGEPVSVNVGRFGPYVKFGGSFASLKPGDDPYTVSLERALELIAAKREADAAREIRRFEGTGVRVLKGRFGPYVTDGTTNASLRRDDDPNQITNERAYELLAEKRAKGPTTRKTAKKTTRKAPAKKATARKTTAAKTTAAKATATKPAAAKKTTAAKATTKTTAARATKPPTA